MPRASDYEWLRGAIPDTAEEIVDYYLGPDGRKRPGRAPQHKPFRLPPGTYQYPDGRWRIPALGEVIPEGARRVPAGSIVYAIGRKLHFDDRPPGDQGTPNLRDIVLDFRADGEDSLVDRNDVVVRITRFGHSEWNRETGVGVRWSTPIRGVAAGRRATWVQDGLDWRVIPTKTGVKVESDLDFPLGPRQFERRFLILTGGHGRFDQNETLTLGEDGALHYGDHFHTPAWVFVSRAPDYEGQEFSLGAWVLDPTRQRLAVFNYDDSHIPPEAFPGTIDPSTQFNVAVSGDDGFIQKPSSAVYPPNTSPLVSATANIVAAGRNYASSAYDVWVSLMRWDTSFLPDADVIGSATLRVYPTVIDNVDIRNLTADWYTAWPIDGADFVDTHQTGAISAVPLSSFTVNASNDVALTGYDQNVSRTDYTGIRIHIDGGQPTGRNRLHIASFDHTTSPEPILLVETSDGGGGTTRVGRSTPLSWHTRAAVNRSASLGWHLRNTTAREAPLSWAVRQSASHGGLLVWDTRGNVSRGVLLAWTIHQRVSHEVSLGWHVRSPVARDAPLDWSVRQSVSRDALVVWHLREAVTRPAVLAWDIRAPVSRTAALAWTIRRAVDRSAPLEWHVREVISASALVAWMVESALARVGRSASLDWDIRSPVSLEASFSWDVRQQVQQGATLLWNVRESIARDALLSWAIRAGVARGATLSWAVRGLVSHPALLLWYMRQRISHEAELAWHIRQAVDRPAVLEWSVRAVISRSAVLLWIVEGAQGMVRIRLEGSLEQRLVLGGALQPLLRFQGARSNIIRWRGEG